MATEAFEVGPRGDRFRARGAAGLRRQVVTQFSWLLGVLVGAILTPLARNVIH